MKTIEDRYAATCRISDAERRRLLSALDVAAEAPPTRIRGRSYVRKLRDRDFIARSNDRPQLVAWMAFITAFIRMFTPRRRQTTGTGVGIIVDDPILDLLGIAPETEVDLTTDGTCLVITPLLSPKPIARPTGKPDPRIINNHAGTFRKQAW